MLTESDVQITKDNIPVIYHDFLMSETGIDVPLHKLSLEQVSTQFAHYCASRLEAKYA